MAALRSLVETKEEHKEEHKNAPENQIFYPREPAHIVLSFLGFGHDKKEIQKDQLDSREGACLSVTDVCKELGKVRQKIAGKLINHILKGKYIQGKYLVSIYPESLAETVNGSDLAERKFGNMSVCSAILETWDGEMIGWIMPAVTSTPGILDQVMADYQAFKERKGHAHHEVKNRGIPILENALELIKRCHPVEVKNTAELKEFRRQIDALMSPTPNMQLVTNLTQKAISLFLDNYNNLKTEQRKAFLSFVIGYVMRFNSAYFMQALWAGIGHAIAGSICRPSKPIDDVYLSFYHPEESNAMVDMNLELLEGDGDPSFTRLHLEQLNALCMHLGKIFNQLELDLQELKERAVLTHGAAAAAKG